MAPTLVLPWPIGTIFDRVANDMTIAREEIFGPVLATLTFKDADEAIRIANDSIYGLQASLWTNDLSKAHKVARVHAHQPASDGFGGSQSSSGNGTSRQH